MPIALSLAHHQFVCDALRCSRVAAASDAADGFLAKRFGWQTRLGAVLDPIADKLMLATVFVMLAALRLVPLWLMAAAVARDCIIVLGAVAYRICSVRSRRGRRSSANSIRCARPCSFWPSSAAQQFSWPPAWVVCCSARWCS